MTVSIRPRLVGLLFERGYLVKDKTLYYEDQVGPQTQWIFDVGTEVHELQRRLGSTGKLFGLWECKLVFEEKYVHYGFTEKKYPLNTDLVKWNTKFQSLMKNWKYTVRRTGL